jgi:DNA mismatch endonuclease Vsr
MDRLTKEQRRKNMQAVKSSGSLIETLLRKALWKRGYRYRKNDRNLIGKPDIVLTKYKIAIFCDSEFWHGYNWDNKKKEIHSNREFWIKKIESNIARDIVVAKALSAAGWYVVRFWGNDIKKDVNACATYIEELIKTHQT